MNLLQSYIAASSKDGPSVSVSETAIGPDEKGAETRLDPGETEIEVPETLQPSCDEIDTMDADARLVKAFEEVQAGQSLNDVCQKYKLKEVI